MPLHSGMLHTADGIRQLIDDMALTLTGDREYFHIKQPPSHPERPF